ncbi:pyridoxamine 5'-phosphate oxidase family protein [Mangrovivirga sp. M17]|uniref:Pyridoxamine 5'-phosphate oxidase family protein n=1 Tax=Mangrovivirga halotolerans TaxID=2993936 RepID=A0ABT3RVG9_9BACT|nr:pyridoxamine 5'-phosphate oxidase family protein [Mangrovivirga halotolerans]MCX2745348.1 pyridoxamine 5'-phosphate oxidase family protein [Mangrovivirga halotolerans]
MGNLITQDLSLNKIKSTILNELQRAGEDNRSEFHFVILSTVNRQTPDSRYVVLRKFIPEERKAFIYTDIRSDKIEQIKGNYNVSILTYGKNNRCQVKLTGTCIIHHKDEISRNYYNSLSDGKESYNSKNPPGTKKENHQATQELKDEFDDEYFAVLEVNISQIEVLQLNKERHIRCLFDFDKKEESWLVP